MKDHEHKYNLANLNFSDIEFTTMFLDHLDHPCFRLIRGDITTILHTLTTVPPEYLVPSIVSTISQTVNIPMFTQDVCPTAN